MGKKKNKFSGQINFMKVSAVLGLILIIYIVKSFLDSAPALSKQTFHKPEAPVEECLSCHVQKVKDSPIMPHRPMDTCTFCHKPNPSE